MTFLNIDHMLLQNYCSKRMGGKNLMLCENIYQNTACMRQKNNSIAISVPCKLNVYSTRNVFFVEKRQLSSCTTNHKIPIFLPYQLYKNMFPKDTID